MNSFKLKYLYSLILFLQLFLLTSYAEAPYEVNCPKFDLIRESHGELCSDESEYIKNREDFTSNKVLHFLKQYEDSDLFWSNRTLRNILNKPPNWGLAISGGGYRSMLISSGIIKEMNKICLFDCLTYISGLSGGSWVLLDLLLHNFDPDIILKNWDLKTGVLKGVPEFDLENIDIISGMEELNITQLRKRGIKNNTKTNLTHGTGILKKRDTSSWYGKLKHILSFEKQSSKENTYSADKLKLIKTILNFYINLHLEVKLKKLKGFSLSFTDYWGKALLKRLNTKISFQSESSSFYELIRRNTKFQRNEAPLLIFVANCKNDHMKNFIFEFTPFEFGSWEPSAGIFINLKYLGSRIINGVAKTCFHEFDDIGFIAATSSSIFNNAILYVWKEISNSSKEIVDTMRTLMGTFGLSNSFDNHLAENRSNSMIETDYAIYKPNPFFLYDNDKITPSLTKEDYLYLVDGGEDGENIPLRTLLIPERNMEVVFIIDSSSDKENYTNGTKMETILKIAKKYGIDYTESGEFLIEKYTFNEPKVFGCHLSNTNGFTPPVLIYMANTDHSFSTNTSTFKVTYNDFELNNMLESAKMMFTGDKHKEYEKCLPCFLIKRRIDSNFAVYEQDSIEYKICSKCYDIYCLN